MELLGNHPNVVKFVGAVTRGGHLALVTEFCANGSLYDKLYKSDHDYTAAELLCMARDIASAISHLHSEGVIHRYIATRNVLLTHDMTVRVSDFGMSRVITKAEESQVNTTHSNIGPVKWMAPESIRKKEYSEKTDAFSYGVLLWEMYTRREPYEGMAVLDVAVGVAREGLRLEAPADADPTVQDLMKRCWRLNPAERPTFAEMVAQLDARVKEVSPDVNSDSDTDDDGGGSFESAGSIGVPMRGDVSYSIPSGASSASEFEVLKK